MAEQLGTVEVGQPESQSLFSGQRGRLLLIGGAGVAVAAVLLLSRQRGSANASAAETGIAPGTLTPDAAIALGSLEARTREQAGRLEQLFNGFSDDFMSRSDRLEDTLLGQIDASQRAQFQALTDVIRNAEFNVSADVRGQALNILNDGKSPEQRRYNTWVYAKSLSTTPEREAYYNDWLRQSGIDPETGDPLV